MAKNTGVGYARGSSQGRSQVQLPSTATEGRVHRVTYKSQGDGSEQVYTWATEDGLIAFLQWWVAANKEYADRRRFEITIYTGLKAGGES